MKIRRRLRLIAVLFIATNFTVPGSAGELADTSVTTVLTQAQNAVGANRVCISVSDPISGTPACNVMGRLCADLDQPIGRALLSTALTAYTTGKRVKLAGKGACDIVSNSEDLAYIELRP